MSTRGSRPILSLLSAARIEQIIDEAYETLDRVGVNIECGEAVDILACSGARVSDDRGRVFLPRPLVEKCVGTVPRRFDLFDRDGAEDIRIGASNTIFVPGSAAVLVHDFDNKKARPPSTPDVIDFVRVTDRLPVFAAQSTGIVPADVPEPLADRYRLFLALIFGRKPVITGTFALDGFETMRAMLAVVRGSDTSLREKPMAVFDCCPSPPLAWSELTCRTLIDCARHAIPVDIVSMPLPGATAPVTLAGALVQHTAETLSGIAIHQTTAPGAPVVYGGAPACFDMREGTTPLGAAETMLMDIAYVRIAKTMKMPSHTYMGLSDAKTIDYQAGAETAMGAALAALAGVDIMAGPGMLDFVNCQSLEKLILDAEACASARRLLDGIAFREQTAGLDVLSELADGGNFLTAQHTRRYFRDEVYYPSPVIDRSNMNAWKEAGALTAPQRAHERVAELLAAKGGTPPPGDDVLDALERLMLDDARRYGLDTLPDWRSRIES